MFSLSFFNDSIEQIFIIKNYKIKELTMKYKISYKILSAIFQLNNLC